MFSKRDVVIIPIRGYMPMSTHTPNVLYGVLWCMYYVPTYISYNTGWVEETSTKHLLGVLNMDWDLLAAYMWIAGPTIHPSSFLVDEDHRNVWFLQVFNDLCHACNFSMQVGCGTFGACLKLMASGSMIRLMVQKSGFYRVLSTIPGG